MALGFTQMPVSLRAPTNNVRAIDCTVCMMAHARLRGPSIGMSRVSSVRDLGARPLTRRTGRTPPDATSLLPSDRLQLSAARTDDSRQSVCSKDTSHILKVYTAITGVDFAARLSHSKATAFGASLLLAESTPTRCINVYMLAEPSNTS
jgi:hypothetical protein